MPGCVSSTTGRPVPCPPGRGQESGTDVINPAVSREGELTGGGTIEKVGPTSTERAGRLAEEEARERQRRFLESELARARTGQSALRERAREITETGLRTIREGERLRRGQAESSIATLGQGAGRSRFGERVRRAGREATTMAEEQFQSKVLIEQYDQEFKAEQAAIDRLFRSGQEELAFLRQIRLIDRQAYWQQELEKLRQGNAAWEAFGGFIGKFLGPVGSKVGEQFAEWVFA